MQLDLSLPGLTDEGMTDIRADAVERAGVEEGVREAVRHAGRAEHVVSREESSQEGINGVIVETGQLEIHVNIAGVNTLAYRVTSDESRSEE